jgi:hypothetical protein
LPGTEGLLTGKKGSREACKVAMAMFDPLASIPTVFAPNRARLFGAFQQDVLLDMETSTHLGQEPTPTTHVQTPLPFEPTARTPRRLPLGVGVSTSKSPLGLVMRVQGDLVAQIRYSRRVHPMQQLKLASRVPPLRGEGGEVFDLRGVDRGKGRVRLGRQRSDRGEGPRCFQQCRDSPAHDHNDYRCPGIGSTSLRK